MATYTGLSIRLNSVVNESGNDTGSTIIYTVPAGVAAILWAGVANGQTAYFTVDGSQVGPDSATTAGNARSIFLASDGAVVRCVSAGAVEIGRAHV